MGMATNTEDEEEIIKEFDTLACFFHEIKNIYFQDSPSFKEISMGMSDDYPLAIEKGSMADYIISSMAETAIMDVYPYSAEPDVKPEFPGA